MKTIGIDPGLTGAIAVLDDRGELVLVVDMPTVVKKKKGREVCAATLAKILTDIAPPGSMAILEQVNAMPSKGARIGVTSAFGFGDSFGVVRGVLGALKIPVTRVMPGIWKQRAKLIGAQKDRARTLAIERWPGMVEAFTRKSDIGRADAALIGLHGRPIVDEDPGQ